MAPQKGKVRVGTAGWSYDDWKGVVYPVDMPRSLHPVTFLGHFFDTVEVNASFYRPLNPRHTASWASRVEENQQFRFTVKMWQRFTHEREAWPSPFEIKQFHEGVRPLDEAGRLGAVLVQFPWSFKRTPQNRIWLSQVLEAFAAYPLALEIRHASWNRPEVYEALAQHKVAFCNIDQPLFHGSLAPSATVTARVGYVRLHGRNAADWFREDAGRNERYDYLYSRDELREWVEKIERIRDMAEEVYVITNNHYRGQAVVNAFELKSDLGLAVPDMPGCLIENYPRLVGLKPDR